MNTQKNWHLKLNWRRGTYALTFPIYWRINGKIGLQVPDHVEDITLRLWVLLGRRPLPQFDGRSTLKLSGRCPSRVIRQFDTD